MSAARKNRSTASTTPTTKRRPQTPDPSPGTSTVAGATGEPPLAYHQRTARRPRLSVTEAERLCYSRCKLHAISALRNAGLDPTVCGLHKDYRVPGMRGKVYLLKHPGSIVYAFSTLAEIEGYAAEWQTRNVQPRSTWNPWRSVPPVSEPKRVGCAWQGCSYPANGMLAGEPVCSAHAIVYEQMLLASGRQVP